MQRCPIPSKVTLTSTSSSAFTLVLSHSFLYLPTFTLHSLISNILLRRITSTEESYSNYDQHVSSPSNQSVQRNQCWLNPLLSLPFLLMPSFQLHLYTFYTSYRSALYRYSYPVISYISVAFSLSIYQRTTNTYQNKSTPILQHGNDIHRHPFVFATILIESGRIDKQGRNLLRQL